MVMAPLIERLSVGRSHGLCQRCGGAIPSSRRRDAVYCSTACRQTTNREKWKQRNPDEHRAAQQRYRDANREACNQRVRDHYERNPAAKREQQDRWLADNRARVNARERERRSREREANPARAYLKKKASHLWTNYRLTFDAFVEMIEAQDGRCAICCAEVDDLAFHVDHDHATGRVRGLLCRLCNPMLGMARENPETLRAAIDYLERST